MYHIRLELHKTAYRHKVCSAVELMILDAFDKANKVFKFEKKIEDIEEYCQLNDSIREDIINFKFKNSIYMNAINDLDENREEIRRNFEIIQNKIETELKDAQYILNRIETRKLYKFISQTILKKPQEIDENKIKNEVNRLNCLHFKLFFFILL